MSRICLYYRTEPERDRWLLGDRHIRPAIRRLVRGKGGGAAGVAKVFANLCLGLDRLGIAHEVNLPFSQLRPDDRVGVIGVGRSALDGYDRSNPIVAGIGLMTHPREWPTLCDDYPVAFYLQQCDWANDLYKPYFGTRCRIWPVGIDTYSWCPGPPAEKRFDFLVYDKIRWRRDEMVPRLLDPVRAELARRGLSFAELRYGAYGRAGEGRYRSLLRQCRAMIFLCENETQGFACLEALASSVPVLAWDPGRWLDPNWGQPDIPATSVPYFDERCGLAFRDGSEFSARLDEFLVSAAGGRLVPRDYVLENLTLERCSAHFVELLDQARTGATLAA